ncbi:MAG: hypothetical protein QOJ02_4242 [Acidobacteriota bacterium]|jgi:hypothetical protein|nr:hypothetical protein [Acidobacteriota bacterium]
MMVGDIFELYYYGVSNPLAEGVSGVEKILSIINEHARELMPDEIHVRQKMQPYSIEAVNRLLSRKAASAVASFNLTRSNDPKVSYNFSFMGRKSQPGFWLWMMFPLSYFAEVDRAQARSRAFVSLIKALAEACPPDYGWGHSQADLSLGENPARTDPFAPRQVYEVYWLNLYGERMVKRLGRKRVHSTPAYELTELPSGGVMLLTGATPSDYASEQARLAQARALAHLRDDVNLDAALARLRERSARLIQGERDWDPDIEYLLDLTMNFVPYEQRPQRTVELNQYRPPEVDEWRPTKELLESDVEDVEAAIKQYSSLYAEQLVMLLHDKVPQVMKALPDSLPLIDYYFWRNDYPGKFGREHIDEKLVPAIGGYLGKMLVRDFGGHWVPRRNLYEAQVVIGERAWLPFLRAQKYMRSKQAVLDYSLTKFYRTVGRYAEERRADSQAE